MQKEREKQEKHTVTVEAYEKETDSEVAALLQKLTVLKQEVAELFHCLDD